MINFSFIILFHDNNSTDCVLDSILSQTIAGDELIVVNDHSKAENLHIFDRFQGLIQLVHSDKKGNRGYNRNFGAAYAHNDYLLFVDGDIIFLPNAISAMRESMEKGNVGAVGNVVCSSNTVPQMNLVTGIDYLNLVQNELGWENIVKLGLLYDRRQHYIFDKIALDSVWEYFYTAYCAVKRDIFEQIGGFETSFVGWGVEDDELGYRLHLNGKLEYNQSAYGIHAPHMRDLYKCLISNRINLYRFLAKYPSNEIELHMTFGNSVKINIALDYIKNRLTNVGTSIYDFPYNPNCIYINELTDSFPHGYIRFYGNNMEPHVLELYGIALPFKNKNFEIAYCSENLFVYPEAFAAVILTEMLRVAKEVHIIKVTKQLRIQWDSNLIGGLTSISTSGRIVYMPTQVCDFDIVDCGNYYKINDGITAKLNEHFVVDENFYHPEYFNTEPQHYILINLSGETLSQNELSYIKVQYNICIDNCYEISVELPSKDIRLTHVLYGDLYRLHTPMLYLIPQGHHIVKDDRWWEYSFRKNDIIIQKM